MDQLLGVESLLYRVARTGMDDRLRTDLVVAVDAAGKRDSEERLEELLYPIAMRDDYCRAGHAMVCRGIQASDAQHFHVAMWPRNPADVALGRRLALAAASMNVFLDNHLDEAWRLIERCTTGDRCIVLGLTCAYLRHMVTGEMIVPELVRVRRVGDDEEGDDGPMIIGG